MNNPFAPVAQATPPAPPPVASSNPFAAVAPAGAVGGAGVQAIQAAFAQAAPGAAPVNPFAAVAAPATQHPPLNPPGEAGLGLQPPPKPRTTWAEQQALYDASPLSHLNPAAEDWRRTADAPYCVPTVEAPAPAVVEPDAPAPRARRGRKPKGEKTVQQKLDEAEAQGDEPEDFGAESPAVHEFAQHGLGAFTTEQLRDELKNRGWSVELTDGAP